MRASALPDSLLLLLGRLHSRIGGRANARKPSRLARTRRPGISPASGVSVQSRRSLPPASSGRVELRLSNIANRVKLARRNHYHGRTRIKLPRCDGANKRGATSRPGRIGLAAL